MPKTNDLQKTLDDLILSVFQGGKAVKRQYGETRKLLVGQLDELLGQRTELDCMIGRLREMLDKLDAQVAAVNGVLDKKGRATTQQKYNAAEIIYAYLARRRGEKFAAKDLADLTGGYRLNELVEVFNREEGRERGGRRIQLGGDKATRVYWA
jgi:hypothetical protein